MPQRRMQDLLKLVGNLFTSKQDQIATVLEQNGYSHVMSCRVYGKFKMVNRPTISDSCYYKMLRNNDGGIFIVGDNLSIYYGDRRIGGKVGTFRMNCPYQSEYCALQLISDRPGEVLPTKDLLKQLSVIDLK